MKNFKNHILLTAVGLLLLMSACEPIEERESLKNTYKAEDIELEVIQTAGGKGNGLTLKMNTPGVAGYWDYLINRSFSDQVSDIIMPIRGTLTLTFNSTTPLIKGGDPSNREYISKTITINVEEMDQPLPQPYYDLVGEELISKAWVFDRSNENWWYMSSGGPTEPQNPLSLWWNAALDACCTPSDAGGKMVFDLNGAANYTYYKNASDATGQVGTFSFNTSFTKFYIGGGLNILGAEGTDGLNGCAISRGSLAEFQVVELTSDRLVLYIPDGGCDSGWTWIFVPEED